MNRKTQKSGLAMYCIMLAISGCSSTSNENSDLGLNDANSLTEEADEPGPVVVAPDIDPAPDEPGPVVVAPDIDPAPDEPGPVVVAPDIDPAPLANSPRILDVVWRLDSILFRDGTLAPMPLNSRIELLLPSSPLDQGVSDIKGYVLCSEVSGNYLYSDGTLSIQDADGVDSNCDQANLVEQRVISVVNKALRGEKLMTSVFRDTMTLTFGTNEKMFFSGRYLLPQENVLEVTLLDHSESPFSGEGTSNDQQKLIVYRDQPSLDEAYRIHFEPTSLIAPTIDFQKYIVIGGLFQPQRAINSEIAVQYAVESSSGLNVGVTYKMRVDDDPIICSITSTTTELFVLYLVKSRAEPLAFSERKISICSGIEPQQFEQI